MPVIFPLDTVVQIHVPGGCVIGFCDFRSSQKTESVNMVYTVRHGIEGVGIGDICVDFADDHLVGVSSIAIHSNPNTQLGHVEDDWAVLELVNRVEVSMQLFEVPENCILFPKRKVRSIGTFEGPHFPYMGANLKEPEGGSDLQIKPGISGAPVVLTGTLSGLIGPLLPQSFLFVLQVRHTQNPSRTQAYATPFSTIFTSINEPLVKKVTFAPLQFCFGVSFIIPVAPGSGEPYAIAHNGNSVGCVGGAHHHVVAARKLHQMTTTHAAELKPLLPKLQQMYYRYCSIPPATPPTSFSKLFVWGPWNLFLGPHTQRGDDDTTLDMEPVKPPTFDAPIWEALRQLNACTDGIAFTDAINNLHQLVTATTHVRRIVNWANFNAGGFPAQWAALGWVQCRLCGKWMLSGGNCRH